MKKATLFLLLFALSLLGASSLMAEPNDTADGPTLASPVYDIYEQNVVLVEFAPAETIRLRAGEIANLDQSRAAESVDAMSALDALTAGGEWVRPYTLSEAEIDTIHQQGELNIGKSLPNLNNRLRLILPDGLDAVEAQAQLSQLPLIEAVHLVPKPVATPLNTDYSQSTGNNSNNAYQKYLDAAPNGIDARYAWQIPKGDGVGIKICDIEYDYNAHHADLNNVTYVGAPADPPFADNHGTAVLGMIGGSDNGYGVKGIAYRASLYFAAAKTTTGNYSIANAILACMGPLGSGDVILIEQQMAGPNYVAANAPSQLGLVPTEWYKPTYDAIKLATAAGITVVQAAGNGAQDLDSSTYTTGNSGHHPFETGNDSGAIMVGAGKPPGFGARSAADFSNYGDTVDLQGWGGSIVTTGYNNLYDDEGKDLWYTNSFGGTSGASPMVTSAAAIVQAVYTDENGSPASPAQVKQILRDTGTAQTGAKNIGPMPNLRDAINDVSTADTVEPPIIDTPSGTYQMPLQVKIEFHSSHDPNTTHIRYTLNGSEPTPDSFIYLPNQGDTLYLNYGVTLRVKAFLTGGGESATATAIYASSTPKVETPIISPSAGTYNQGTQLILTSSTPGANIKYRLDGRTPSFFYQGTDYTGPVTLAPGNHEVVARAYKTGFYKSDVARADISINEIVLPTPVIYPNGGDFNGSVTVYLGSTVLGADIRYTLDGSTPTESSPQFVEPIVLEETTTIKARVFLDGYGPSLVLEKLFNVTQQTDAPTFDPPSGTTATDTLEFELESTTAGATIRYTTNGAEPTSYSTEYIGPVTLNHGEHTVKAKAFLGGAQASGTSTAEYTVYDPANQIDPPVVYPPVGNYNGPITVSITSETEGVFISYTTDGSDPFTSGTVQGYNGPFVLTGSASDYLIRTRAFKASATPTSVAGTPPVHRLTVVNPTLGQVETPNIDPPSGTYTNTFTAKITAPDFNPPFKIRGLHITEDGTMPLANRDNQQSGAVPVNKSVSESSAIKAIASQVGYENSEVATAEYILKCETPTLSPTGVYTSVLEVEMSTGTTGAKIYYTTDGSEPTDSSPTYEGLFPVNESTTVRAFCTKPNFEDSESTTAVYAFEEAATVPAMDQQPESTTAVACTEATFTGTATGTEVLSYQWFKDGEILAGETDAELEIPAVRPIDEGNYVLIVTNIAGAVTSQTASLAVTGEDDCADNPPVITTHPQTQSAVACTATTLSVAASGADPLSYQWFKDGAPVTGETTAMLSIDPTTAADDGVYTVVVTNDDGSVTSNAADLTVTGSDAACINQPPTIVEQPQNQEVSVCGIATFSVSANGSRPFSYQWLKGGTAIDGATNATYTLNDVQNASEGLYSVTVTNSAGDVTSTTAALFVNGEDKSCTAGPLPGFTIYLPMIQR